MAQSFLMIFIGGGLGSVVRFALGRWINTLHHDIFPYSTLVVNVIACLTLGCIIGLAEHKQLLSPTTRVFWSVGFCGGFSTFSTFSQESLSLIQSGFTVSGFAYITVSIVLCMLAVYIGMYAGERF